MPDAVKTLLQKRTQKMPKSAERYKLAAVAPILLDRLSLAPISS